MEQLKPAPVKEKRGPGRPKLGGTARQVTLLPRHWDWLAGQPGGASTALRKLVETALRDAEGPDRARKARDAAYAFMTAMAGDRPGCEEAVRALFAGDEAALEAAMKGWPEGGEEAGVRNALPRRQHFYRLNAASHLKKPNPWLTMRTARSNGGGAGSVKWGA